MSERTLACIIITLAIAVFGSVSYGNYIYQRNIVRRTYGTDNFVARERAKGRGGEGGVLAIFGVIPVFTSFISEDTADAISETIYSTSSRKGREVLEKYNRDEKLLEDLKSRYGK